MAMGFDEDQCELALKRSHNSVDRALDMLLSGCDLKGSAENSNVLQLEISQYTFSDAGSSACTAIALSAMASVVTMLDSGNAIDFSSDRFRIALSDSICNGVSQFSTTTVSRDRHASVEEIGTTMVADFKSVTDVPVQGMLSDAGCFASTFATVRTKAVDLRKYIGIVITKPPETVCVVIPPVSAPAGEDTFVFFDSHSRPELGFDGCYLVSSHHEQEIIDRLNTIFPAFAGFSGAEGGGDEDHDLAEAMYNMFDATAFQSL